MRRRTSGKWVVLPSAERHAGDPDADAGDVLAPKGTHAGAAAVEPGALAERETGRVTGRLEHRRPDDTVEPFADGLEFVQGPVDPAVDVECDVDGAGAVAEDVEALE